MSLRGFISQCLNLMSENIISDWDITAEKQSKLLYSFKEPKDLIDRAFCQFCCHKLFFPKGSLIKKNIISAFVAPFYLLLALCKKKKAQDIYVDAIGTFGDMKEIIPISLQKQYKINNDIWSYAFSLNFSDISFLWKIWIRHPLSPYFFLKCMMNTSRYSHIISLYSPNAIIEHAEYSFTSSIKTAYCRRKKVKHINVMHGEKRLLIRDSFFEYDICYVWDEFYINLFSYMRCPVSQFVVEVPPSLQIDKEKHQNPMAYADVKYYLWEDNLSSLKTIVESMKIFKNVGLLVKYRPHPRWCKTENLLKVMNKEDIEDVSSIDIVTSLANVRYVVGFGTTVLYQAYMSHIAVIIDDVTYYDKYVVSKEKRYHLVEVGLPRLSSLKVEDVIQNPVN